MQIFPWLQSAGVEYLLPAWDRVYPLFQFSKDMHWAHFIHLYHLSGPVPELWHYGETEVQSHPERKTRGA